MVRHTTAAGWKLEREQQLKRVPANMRERIADLFPENYSPEVETLAMLEQG